MTARTAQLLLAIVFLAACGPASTTEPPDPCNQTTNFTFVGRTTAGAIGLAEPGDPSAPAVGTAWVTAERVDWGGGPETVQRAVCLAFDDGTASGQSIPDDWDLPPDVIGAAEPPAEAGDAGSMLLIVLVLGALAVSVVAFVGGGNGRRSAS